MVRCSPRVNLVDSVSSWNLPVCREQDVPIESFLFGSHLTDRLTVSFNLSVAGKRRGTDGGADRKDERVREENSESHRIRIS